MYQNPLKIGISGDLQKLKEFTCALQEKGSIYERYPARHFSLGIRPWDKLEDELIDSTLGSGVTLSIHPVDINFSGELDFDELHALKKIVDRLPAIYIEEDIGLWRIENLFLGAHQINPPMTKPLMDLTLSNSEIVQDLFRLPVALENPPVYYEFGNIDFWDFYGELCSKTGLLMAFDIGHYLGYCKSKNVDARLPSAGDPVWKKIKTIHMSGMKSWMWNGVPVWLDQHSDRFSDELLNICEAAATCSPCVHNILLEIEGAPPDVESHNLNEISELVQRIKANGSSSPRYYG